MQLLAHVRHAVLHAVSTTTDDDEAVAKVLAVLQQLEVTDPRFGRYRLVKDLKSSIRDSLGAEAARLGARLASARASCTAEDPLVCADLSVLRTKLSDSAAGSSVHQAVNSRLDDAVDQLVSSRFGARTGQEVWDVEFSAIDKQLSPRSTESGDKPVGAENDDRGSVASDGVLSFSSFNSLPPFDRIVPLTRQLVEGTTEADRLDALHGLRQFAPGDLLHSEHWIEVQSSLSRSLGDRGLVVQTRAVDFLWHLFRDASPVSPIQTGELCQMLISHITSNHRYLVVCSASASSTVGVHAEHARVVAGVVIRGWHHYGVNMQAPPVAAVLQKFRLLDKMLLELPNHWVHFPDSLYDRCVVGVCALLRARAFVPRSGGELDARSWTMSAGDTLSLIDPTARWFAQWVVQARPREQLVRYLHQSGVLQDLVLRSASAQIHSGVVPMSDSVLLAAQTSNPAAAGRPLVGWLDVQSMSTLSAMGMLSQLIEFAEGRGCFPIVLPRADPRAGLADDDLTKLSQTLGTPDLSANNRIRNLATCAPDVLTGVHEGLFVADLSKVSPSPGVTAEEGQVARLTYASAVSLFVGCCTICLDGTLSGGDHADATSGSVSARVAIQPSLQLALVLKQAVQISVRCLLEISKTGGAESLPRRTVSSALASSLVKVQKSRHLSQAQLCALSGLCRLLSEMLSMPPFAGERRLASGIPPTVEQAVAQFLVSTLRDRFVEDTWDAHEPPGQLASIPLEAISPLMHGCAKRLQRIPFSDQYRSFWQAVVHSFQACEFSRGDGGDMMSTWTLCLRDMMCYLAMTAPGVVFAQKVGVLPAILESIEAAILAGDISRTARSCVAQLALHPEGAKLLCSSNVLSHLIADIENSVSDPALASQLNEELAHTPRLCVALRMLQTVLASPHFAKLILQSDVTLPVRTPADLRRRGHVAVTVVSERPLHQLRHMLRVVGLKQHPSSEPEGEPEVVADDAHFIGLQLLASMVLCFDTLYSLNTRWHIKRQLLRLNASGVAVGDDDSAVAISQCVLQRFAVLANPVLMVWGPTEHVVLPQTPAQVIPDSCFKIPVDEEEIIRTASGFGATRPRVVPLGGRPQGGDGKEDHEEEGPATEFAMGHNTTALENIARASRARGKEMPSSSTIGDLIMEHLRTDLPGGISRTATTIAETRSFEAQCLSLYSQVLLATAHDSGVAKLEGSEPHARVPEASPTRSARVSKRSPEDGFVDAINSEWILHMVRYSSHLDMIYPIVRRRARSSRKPALVASLGAVLPENLQTPSSIMFAEELLSLLQSPRLPFVPDLQEAHWYLGVLLLLLRNTSDVCEVLQLAAHTGYRSACFGVHTQPALDAHRDNRAKGARSGHGGLLGSGLSHVAAIAHAADYVLTMSAPQIAAAFKSCGATLLSLCSIWLPQCFIGTLDFPDVARYVVLSTLQGATFQVYFLCALLRQHTAVIVELANKQALPIGLALRPLNVLSWDQLIRSIKSMAKLCGADVQAMFGIF